MPKRALHLVHSLILNLPKVHRSQSLLAFLLCDRIWIYLFIALLFSEHHTLMVRKLFLLLLFRDVFHDLKHGLRMNVMFELVYFSCSDIIELRALALIFFDIVGNIRDESGHDDFNAKKNMLSHDEDQNHLENATFTSAKQVIDSFRVAIVTVLVLTFGGEEQNSQVDGDRDKRDQLHDTCPATDAVGTLCNKATAEL